jgi:hypothetical protein
LCLSGDESLVIVSTTTEGDGTGRRRLQ